MAITPTAVDLFAGAGGLGSGLVEAGFRVVAANEYDPVFGETYQQNHSDTEVVVGDILDSAVRSRILRVSKGVDLVAGGPPCQGFSTVGSKREHDPRNRLFYSFVEIVERLQPRAVLFENVSGFRRMYGGRAYHALVESLHTLGYATHHQILNALNYGVPQSRDRAFVIGFRDSAPFQFPSATHGPGGLLGELPYLTLADALSDLPLIQSGEVGLKYAKRSQNSYQAKMRQGVRRLTEHEGPNHGEKLAKMMSFVGVGGTIADVPEELRPRSYFANTYSRLWWDRPSTTVTRNFGTPSSSRCIHPFADRGLTTREGARLQSFPDWYKFRGTRTEKNLQIGNAVPPLLAEALGVQVFAAITRKRPRLSRAAEKK